MSDGIYEAVSDDENDAQVIDLDQVFGDDVVEDVLDTSWSPSETPRAVDSFGTTLDEEPAGETRDPRLAQEEPDSALAVDLVDGEIVEGGEILNDREVGALRVGRLVAPDEGTHEDTEKDVMVAHGFGVERPHPRALVTASCNDSRPV